MKITVRQLKKLIREAVESGGRMRTHGAIEGSTADIVAAIEEHLRSLGHTNVKSVERWEGDGVMEIWSDQATESRSDARYGWVIYASGDDTQFGGGVDFRVTLQGQRDKRFTLKTWEELFALIDQRWW